MNPESIQTDTIKADEPVTLDLVLRKSKSSSIVINCIAIEYLDNDKPEEFKYKMEVRKATQSEMDADTGLSEDEYIRKYCICIWEWPLANGSRTTREQFSARMLEQLLGADQFIKRSIIQHLVQSVKGLKIADLHREMRKGN